MECVKRGKCVSAIFILFWNELESSLLSICIVNIYKTVWFAYKQNSFIIMRTWILFKYCYEMNIIMRKENIIPKHNSWLAEAANIRVAKCIAKMRFHAARWSLVYIWTQTWFLMGFIYVKFKFLLRPQGSVVHVWTQMRFLMSLCNFM